MPLILPKSFPPPLNFTEVDFTSCALGICGGEGAGLRAG